MSTALEAADESEAYEEAHVHKVYEVIAPHFSQTRYKPWPLITKFLLSLPPGSIGLDVGCGNGKYLDINPHIYIVGSDRSQELVQIACQEKRGKKRSDVVVGDVLDLPHGNGLFDFAISIAVVHHLSTRERRVEAIKSILATLRKKKGGLEGGRALIYVWALEQKSSRRGWDKGDTQDVMVPWVMKQGVKGEKNAAEEKTFKRYYHLYREGELEEDVREAGGAIIDHGYERDNWWVVATRAPDE